MCRASFEYSPADSLGHAQGCLLGLVVCAIPAGCLRVWLGFLRSAAGPCVVSSLFRRRLLAEEQATCAELLHVAEVR
jgi:hypothetical protein